MVTMTELEVVMLPAASRAVADRMWRPFDARAVFQLPEYGELMSSAPRFEPSSLNWTPAMPTLSEAVAEIRIEPDTVAPVAGAAIETVGSVESEIIANVAVMIVLEDKVMLHEPVPEQPPPDHPEKVEPEAGVAVRTTAVLVERAEEVQVEPQLILPTDEETVPEPLPCFVTETVYVDTLE